MTTRHTISHADELYSGNAYLDGYSPDGRRGVLRSHLHYHKYGPLAAADDDCIVSSWTGATTASNCNGTQNWLAIATGAFASSATPTVITIYSASYGYAGRNIVYKASADESGKTIVVTGRDIYGNTMVERITGPNASTSSGVKCFAYVDKITSSTAHASTVSIGIGNTIGLPFALATELDLVGLSMDGYFSPSESWGPTAYTINLGLGASASFSATVVSTSSQGDRDVLGSINMIKNLPDGTKVYGVLMNVDASTKAKAFGLAQCTAAT